MRTETKDGLVVHALVVTVTASMADGDHVSGAVDALIDDVAVVVVIVSVVVVVVVPVSVSSTTVVVVTTSSSPVTANAAAAPVRAPEAMTAKRMARTAPVDPRWVDDANDLMATVPPTICVHRQEEVGRADDGQ